VIIGLFPIDILSWLKKDEAAVPQDECNLFKYVSKRYSNIISFTNNNIGQLTIVGFKRVDYNKRLKKSNTSMQKYFLYRVLCPVLL